MLHYKRLMVTKLVPEQEQKEKITKTSLNWHAISMRSAQQKYKFKLFSRRVGVGAKYAIAQKDLQFPWTSISNIMPPKDCSFQEAKTKEFMYIAICKFGIIENMIKIPRKK